MPAEDGTSASSYESASSYGSASSYESVSSYDSESYLDYLDNSIKENSNKEDTTEKNNFSKITPKKGEFKLSSQKLRTYTLQVKGTLIIVIQNFQRISKGP